MNVDLEGATNSLQMCTRQLALHRLCRSRQCLEAAQLQPMTNIATLLKGEILRLARKEIRAQVAPLKKSVAAHRSEIAALKRELKDARRMAKGSSKAETTKDEDAPSRFKYSAAGLAAQRKRLELTAEDCGLLVGSTGQSIYKWEAGRAKPRQQYLPRIAALRTYGKKSAAARVAELRSTS